MQSEKGVFIHSAYGNLLLIDRFWYLNLPSDQVVNACDLIILSIHIPSIRYILKAGSIEKVEFLEILEVFHAVNLFVKQMF